MTIMPVRLVQEGEPARRPSILNRPVQDILFGSGYAPDGSDFAGFAKTVGAVSAGSTERTMLFTFGDGAAMEAAGAKRFASIGVNYNPVGWRIRAWDGTGAPTNITAVFTVERVGWDDTITNLVGSGTAPSITAATKAIGNPDNWTGGVGTDGDSVRVTLVSITPLSAVQMTLTIDVVPI